MNEALKDWFERLRKVDMPVFGAVALEVSRLTQARQTPLTSLSNVILQDASMTARVLRIANSAFYTKSSQITTISRAITLLGFDNVGRICLSVALIDSLLRGKPKQGLLKEMAASFYAAMLAKTMAEKREDESAEEVFIAALLYRLGTMAFWCYGGRTAEKLEALLEEPQVDAERAEHTLLGFHLSELTIALAREWNLGDLLITALTFEEEEGGRSRGISLAHEYAALLIKDGDEQELSVLVKSMCRHCKVIPEVMQDIIAQNTQLAIEFAAKVGADIAIASIPGQNTLESSPEEEGEIVRHDKPRDVTDSDAQLQLKILRELVMLATQDDVDATTVIQLALEGLYRGAGLDRVVFLETSPDGKTLRAKYALGPSHLELVEAFSVSLESENLFSESCREDQSLWAPILPDNERKLFSPEVQQILQQGPFLFAPIRPNGVLTGALYADRLPSSRDLDRESSESFELFSFQTRQILFSLMRHHH